MAANDKFEPIKSDPYQNSDVSLLFRVKKTQIEMMQDRGYEIPEEELEFLSMTTSEFAEFLGSHQPDKKQRTLAVLETEYTHPRTGQTLHVHYPDTQEGSKQTGKSLFEPILTKIKNSVELNVCVISRFPISNDMRKNFTEELKTVWSQFFLYEELAFNPTKHVLVPKHELVDQEEDIRAVVMEYWPPVDVQGVKLDMGRIESFPRISIHDPIAKYLGAKPANLIRVHRVNYAFETMVKRYTIYRYVSDSALEKPRKPR